MSALFIASSSCGCLASTRSNIAACGGHGMRTPTPLPPNLQLQILKLIVPLRTTTNLLWLGCETIDSTAPRLHSRPCVNNLDLPSSARLLGDLRGNVQVWESAL